MLINKKHRRLVLTSFFRSQRAVTHDDHFVARTGAASGSAVEANDTAAGFTGNGICRKSLAVVDVDDVNFSYSQMPLAFRRSLSMVIDPT